MSSCLDASLSSFLTIVWYENNMIHVTFCTLCILTRNCHRLARTTDCLGCCLSFAGNECDTTCFCQVPFEELLDYRKFAVKVTSLTFSIYSTSIIVCQFQIAEKDVPRI